jgi:hypothetical protein
MCLVNAGYDSRSAAHDRRPIYPQPTQAMTIELAWAFAEPSSYAAGGIADARHRRAATRVFE